MFYIRRIIEQETTEVKPDLSIRDQLETSSLKVTRYYKIQFF